MKFSIDENGVKSEIEEIVEKYGPWTAHNIEFSPGRFTMGPDTPTAWNISRAEYFGTLAERAMSRPVSQMRVLDLGCLEGGLTFQLAKRGAQAVGLEVREANIEKCRFVQRESGMDNLSFVQADMLNLPDDIGEFDLIIAAGVLYHVDAPDLLPFLQSLKKVCKGVLAIDTHVSLETLEYYQIQGGRKIYGRSITEHRSHENEDLKETRKWASYRNDFAFWPTARSLATLCAEAGFEFIYEPLTPSNEWPWRDRGIWVADARPSVGICQFNPVRLLDPDPRPQTHPQFEKQQFMRPNNPATIHLYD